MRTLFARFSIVLLLAAGSEKADAASYTIDTIAGSSWVGDNGPAYLAILLQAEGVAADANGNLYIADAGDHRVRHVGPDGVIHTVAGTGTRGFSGDGGAAAAAQLDAPYGIALDAYGNLYIADLGNARVRRVAADGSISTVAGGGALAPGGVNEGAQAVQVALSAPRNLALDGAGNLYISDFSGHRVYKLNPFGALTTAAGTGVAGSSGDGGSAAGAQLAYPAGIAVDRQGSLYIADSGNHRIRKVSGGTISAFAHAATPTGLALDGSGVLYVADPSAGQVLKIPPSGAAAAMNVAAQDVFVTANGNLYGSAGVVVLQIRNSGAVSTAAGGGNPGHGDWGPALQARLNHPAGVAMDSAGNLYVADRDNHRVRRVGTDGVITPVAGTGIAGNAGDGGLGELAQLNSPGSVAVDSAGNVYIADTGNLRVRVVTTDGHIRGGTVLGLLSPVYAIPDNAGNIYIADEAAGKILKAGSNGVPATLLEGLDSPHGLALDGNGNLYFTETGAARVRRLTPAGVLSSVGDGVWSTPRGIALDASGALWVADAGRERVYRIDPAGQIAPVAGMGVAGFSGDGGAADAAGLAYPWDVAAGPAGVVVIADWDNHRVRRLTPTVPSQPPAGPVTSPAVDAVNAAGLAPGPIAPGTLLLLRHTGLTPTQIPDTQILFGSLAARIVSADASGILVLAPQEIAGLASVEIDVLYKSSKLAAISLSVAASAPALFTDAAGNAAAGNEDGSVNSASNPAPRGSVVALYGTGLGAPAAPASVTIGGYASEVLYAGPVSGYPGLFQVNVQVPSGYVAPGDLPVVVSAGTASTQAGVAVWVN